LVGLVTVAVLAPNALQSLKMFSPGKKGAADKAREKAARTLNNALYQAVRVGLVAVTIIDGEKVYHLTPKGEQRLTTYRLRDIHFKKPPRWDGKWRMVIFDVREKRRRARDWLRTMLQEFGFKRLQQSVWVFPYECEEFVALLKTDAQFGKDVTYMTVERVEHDALLRKLFRL